MMSLSQWPRILLILATSLCVPLQARQTVSQHANPLPPAREAPLGEMSPKTNKLSVNSESLLLTSQQTPWLQLHPPPYISNRNAVVWIDKDPSGLIVRLNGKPMGSAYDDVKLITLSVDGQRLVFVGKHGRNWHVVIDGQEGATPYQKLDFSFLSADGQRSIVVGQRDASRYVVVNGQEEPAAYEEVRRLFLSEDKQHIVFVASRAGRMYTLIDGQVDANASGADICGVIRLTPEGTLCAWAARREKGPLQIIVDGAIRAEDTASDSYFHSAALSHDRKQLVYGVLRISWSSEVTVVTPAGARVKISGLQQFQQLRFVGQSTHWVAAVSDLDGWHYVVDGVVGPPASALGPFRSTPDGAHWAYAAASGRSGLRTYAEGFIMFDGHEVIRAKGVPVSDLLTDVLLEREVRFTAGVLPYMVSLVHGVSDPVLSPDGSDVSFSYCVSQKEKKVTFRHNKKDGEQFDGIGLIEPADASGRILYVASRPEMLYVMRDETVLHELPVGRDAKVYAFIRSAQGNRNIVQSDHKSSGMKLWVDGQAVMGLLCESIEHLAFTEDEKHWAGLVVKARADKRSFVVLDGREGKHYDEILLESFAVDAIAGARFIARDGLRFFLVEQPWGSLGPS